MRWSWLRSSRANSGEARAALERAEEMRDEVAPLGRELAELEQANHFSAMVRIAISRSREA